MAAPNVNYHQPISVVETTTGLTPFTQSVLEQSGQTCFKVGVPVQLNSGFIRQWDGTTLVNAIAGFSLIPASNLGTNGAGAPGWVSGKLGLRVQFRLTVMFPNRSVCC